METLGASEAAMQTTNAPGLGLIRIISKAFFPHISYVF